MNQKPAIIILYFSYNFQYQFLGDQDNMFRGGFKNKSSLSSSKKQKKEISPSLVKIYGINKGKEKSIKTTSKSKKDSITKYHKRLDTQTYDFPEFSICMNTSGNKNSTSGRETNRKNVAKISSSIQVNLAQRTKEKGQKSNEKKQIKINLDIYTDFILAVSKVFKNLDIFNRGTINQMDISDRIAQNIKKFLGKIFKRIRQDRLTLTEKEFVRMCEPLLKQQPPQKLTKFLQTFNHEEAILKESINISGSAKKPLFPIEQRMIEQERGKTCKIGSETKNSHLQEILHIICEKDRKLQNMIESVKDRKKTSNLHESTGNKQNKSNKTSVQVDEISTNKKPNKIYFDSKIELESFDKKLERLEMPGFETFRQDPASVPSFQFTLPSRPKKYFESKQPGASQPYVHVNISSSERSKKGEVCQQSTRLSHSYNMSGQEKSSTMRLDNSQEVSKIDQLSHKLQEYLQRSKSKIEKSKIFLLENSGLIL